jgi:hypothetical protein
MRFDIRPIRALSGSKLEFDYTLDLSGLALYGERPIPELCMCTASPSTAPGCSNCI